MTRWRINLAAALTASICLFGFTAPAAAKPGHGKWDDHRKLDHKLNDRSNRSASSISRVIVVLYPGCDPGNGYLKAQVRKLRHFGIIDADLLEVPNGQLKKLADEPCVKDVHWDRQTSGEMNRAAIVEGARAVQDAYGYDGTGIGVAVIDSGITNYHDDLTYQGNSPKVKVVNGQRVTKFVDFVNGRLSAYDDNGHGTHVAGIIGGNGYDTYGARAGMAPAANIVSLKVLDSLGGGYISNVIAAMDWIVANRLTYNIRVVNVSVGAAITESYNTDPLTLAARRVVETGVVVVAAAGNIGQSPLGVTQYGGITAPGNAPWVLTVGAYSHEGTLTRTDDVIAPYSSRGPSAIDYAAKPDIVATGTGIVSLSSVNSTMYVTKTLNLLNGSRLTVSKPYLSLTGTSMSAPVVAGTVALMLQANPKLTPNLVKAILQYTAQDYHYDTLTQGAGFLNGKGAVDLAKFLYNPKAGQLYPSNSTWSKTVIWGNKKLTQGVIKPAASAWALNIVWGTVRDAEGDNIVWGTACAGECDNIVWGTARDMDGDNIVWGTVGANEADNIVWGTLAASEADNIVWGTECGGTDCDNIVWGTRVRDGELDNIVWGTAMEADNIVWGTASGEVDNIVWGTSSIGLETPPFDDPDVPSVFDGSIFDALFGSTTSTLGSVAGGGL